MNEPIETAELMSFTKTVEAKSLTRAAAEMRVPRATVSRRLARLEERLGTRLLRRTTRTLVLTEAGEAFYWQARVALEAVQFAEESVRADNDALTGDLRVSVPPMMSASFNAMLVAFAEKHPALRLHINTSNQTVDVLGGGFDLALRASSHIQPGLVARTLFRDPMIAVASPGYIETHGVPLAARDLRSHRCLLGFARGELPDTYWPTLNGGKLRVDGVFFANDIDLLCDAALRGLGVALLPKSLVSQHIERDGLVHVLSDIIGAELHVALVYPERAFLPASVRAFIDAVVEWAQREIAENQRPSRPTVPVGN